MAFKHLLIAAAVAGGGALVASEAMNQDGGDDTVLTGRRDADLRPGGGQNPKADTGGPEVVRGDGAATTVFVKKATLDWGSARTAPTMTRGEEMRAKRARAKRMREELALGPHGAWNGNMPLGSVNTCILKAEFTVAGRRVSGSVWIIRDVRKDGYDCEIVPISGGTLSGRVMNFSAAGLQGRLELDAKGGLLQGTYGGRRVWVGRQRPRKKG